MTLPEGPTTKHSPEAGGSAYLQATDGNDTEEQSQQSVGLLTLELQEINGSKTVNTTNGGGIGDGYVMKDNKEPGVWGPDGLLAAPHVKMVIFLVCVVQVFLSAGLIGAVSQVAIFPRVVIFLGITRWQRLGCLLAVPAFIAVPCSKTLSWNDRSLFFVSVASTALVYCSMAMVNLSLSVASTSMVRSDMRGKMAGLSNMSESFGRFLGPAGSATIFAWSISPFSYDWRDHRFVFLLAAISMALVAVLAWGTITHEHTMTLAEPKVAAGTPVSRNDGKGQGAAGSPSRGERLI